jgi:hypothetical protein
VTWKQALGALVFTAAMLVVPEMAMAAGGIGEPADRLRAQISSWGLLAIVGIGLYLMFLAVKSRKFELVIVIIIVMLIPIWMMSSPREFLDSARDIASDIFG